MSELPLTRSNPDVEGARNNALYGACMRQAHNCKSLDELLAFARHTNGSYSPPMEDSEVMTVAHSAWGYTQRGQNRMGQHGAYFPIAEVAAMLRNQDAFMLLAFLRAYNGPWATFVCTNTLTEKFDWDVRRLRAARTRLIELGYIKPVRQAGRGHPALYRGND